MNVFIIKVAVIAVAAALLAGCSATEQPQAGGITGPGGGEPIRFMDSGVMGTVVSVDEDSLTLAQQAVDPGEGWAQRPGGTLNPGDGDRLNRPEVTPDSDSTPLEREEGRTVTYTLDADTRVTLRDWEKQQESDAALSDLMAGQRVLITPRDGAPEIADAVVILTGIEE